MARPIADPLRLFDCVMPCAGAEGFLVCGGRPPSVWDCASRGFWVRSNGTTPSPTTPFKIRGGWAHGLRATCTSRRGSAPDAIDFLQCYDDYPVISALQFEGLGFCGKGEGPRLHPRQHLRQRKAPSRSTPRAGSCRSARPARPAAISASSRRSASSPAKRGARRVADARHGLVSGFGMINYDRGICSGAAILAAA